MALTKAELAAIEERSRASTTREADITALLLEVRRLRQRAGEDPIVSGVEVEADDFAPCPGSLDP